ncbi:protein strawberry notch homolog 1-like isoform X2 [Mercenaria mercenaria]|uniref:protein strawberry notch homolog 1-like isoform X2 n=1 Tax=Mercenaria mercenaria TaxID=6596 RepID=UPI00234EC145|nr:protein strawberry notch homolog 1-like isoform X2 [Mercenaria mercenaria]
MSWDQAVARADNHSQKQDGFYISKRDVWGKKLFILATQKENSSHLFRIARPNTGLSYFEEEKTDLMQRYSRIDQADAVGSRCYSLHLLCGSIVTFMNILETTLNRNATKLNLSKSESSLRVVRVKLNDGERVVGIRFPQLLIPEVETALKEQRFIEKVQQSQPQMSQYLSSSQGAYNGLSQTFLMSQIMNGQSPNASGLFQGRQLSQQLNSTPSSQNGLSQSSGVTQLLNKIWKVDP